MPPAPPSHDGPVELTGCDTEPIHVPGAIQPFGVLLALQEPALTVVQVSANVADVLSRPPQQLLGSPLASLLAPDSLAHVTAALAGARPEEHNPLPLVVDGRPWEGFLHRHAGATLLELEPAQPEAPEAALQRVRILRRAISRLQEEEQLLALCQTAAREVRRLTGSDRVLLYRFDEEGHGEVLAEARDEAVESFLGLRYPASDIPRPARELYVRNRVRVIPDRDAPASPLVPPLRPDTQQPLDLSLSLLRAVSPIHLEYMRNMGVAASMSIALVQQGRLWGLITCNHRQPHPIPASVRAMCALLGRITAQQLGEAQARQRTAEREQLRATQETLVVAMRSEQEETLQALLRHPRELLSLVDAGGAAIATGDTLQTVGRTPPREALEGLVRWLRASVEEDVLQTKSLGSLYPAAASFQEVASGLLAVRLPRPVPDWVLWFRPQVLQTVRWGGDPTKAVEVEEGGQRRLHPRRSFALWKQEVEATSLPWSAAQVEVAADLRRHAIEVDLGHQVRREQRAVQLREDLVAVVSHDLRNPLGVILVQAGLVTRMLPLGAEGPWVRVHGAIERILRAATRMNSLTQDLLDLSKIESGRFSVSPLPEEVGELLHDGLELLRPLAEQKHLRLTERGVAPGLRVLADRERIFQVLSNLVGNAIKFTPRGGSIEVGAEQVEGGRVRFCVRDTGPGIPPEQLPQVFQRYWQARQTQRLGTGLGLHIARGIVEAHRGTIGVESQPGVGSTFCFTLPLAPETGPE